jgi:RNA polymerase sigma-70 factor (ECF subfamily)
MDRDVPIKPVEQFREVLCRLARRKFPHQLRGTFGQACRDLGREQSLPGAASSSEGAGGLAADQSSPSQQAMHAELVGRLAEALAGLPQGQRQAIVLYYWHGASLAELAAQLGRTPAAVAGLLKRGLKQLRNNLQERG